jgi:hypothetical protein
MPTSTDLVTDLPADFEVFGQAVDTSLADLKGGTTGQILSKTTSTDMDFTWITNDVGDITAVTAGTGISGGGTSGAVTITNSMATSIAAKGDLIVGTGSGTFVAQTVGANGTVLTADSVEADGVKWAALPASSPTSNSATVATQQNTTSATYTDLATAGPAVTITTGTKALVIINSTLFKQASGSNAYVGFAISGATTRAASDTTALNYVAAAYYDSRLSVSHRATSLTAGSNTFTLKYRQNGGGTAEFLNREIIVIDLGS